MSIRNLYFQMDAVSGQLSAVSETTSSSIYVKLKAERCKLGLESRPIYVVSCWYPL